MAIICIGATCIDKADDYHCLFVNCSKGRNTDRTQWCWQLRVRRRRPRRQTIILLLIGWMVCIAVEYSSAFVAVVVSPTIILSSSLLSTFEERRYSTRIIIQEKSRRTTTLLKASPSSPEDQRTGERNPSSNNNNYDNDNINNNNHNDNNNNANQRNLNNNDTSSSKRSDNQQRQNDLNKKNNTDTSGRNNTVNKKRRRKSVVLDPSTSPQEKKRKIIRQIKAKIKDNNKERRRRQEDDKRSDSNINNINKIKTEQKRKHSSNSNSETKTIIQNEPSSQKKKQQQPRKNSIDNDKKEKDTDDRRNIAVNKPKKKKNPLSFENIGVVNPFQVGKNFRETITTFGRGLQLPKETKEKYYIDDRLLDVDNNNNDNNNNILGTSNRNTLPSSLFGQLTQSKTNRLLRDSAEELLNMPEYVPEVLVVGATGEIGRLVVRRLLLAGQGRTGSSSSGRRSSIFGGGGGGSFGNEKFRVRVLVRDLYSQTLNLLGTGVSYCQGDLDNVESLEYALTDVDKIVFVAGSPRSDEPNFQSKFQSYLKEHNIRNNNNQENSKNKNSNSNKNKIIEDTEWEQLSNVLEVRAQLAEQVDCTGMRNLISAYQNVRWTDYGTSQAAKRKLFKFSKNSNDFDLFTLLDDDDDKNENGNNNQTYNDSQSRDGGESLTERKYPYCHDDEYDEDEDVDDYGDSNNYPYDDYQYDYDAGDVDVDVDVDGKYNIYGRMLESRNAARDTIVKSQVRWIRNKFDNGVFVGKVPKATIANLGNGGEAAIISSRLSSREDPTLGIDMSNFAGFIIRLVSGGNNYEAFVRTCSYETDGIEYVYEFGTDSKRPTAENKSDKRFCTVRLAFDNFKPVRQQQHRQQQRRHNHNHNDDSDNDGNQLYNMYPPFTGSDVRYFGFRFRSSSNMEVDNNQLERRMRRNRNIVKNDDNGDTGNNDNNFQSFYLSLSYIKVYRSQPEPEFIYLSDARIPPVIHDGMVQHQSRLIATNNNNDADSTTKETKKTTATTIFDENDLQKSERTKEETYFKYRGEEILTKSGLSYTIIRVAGYNELPSSEASTIDLVQTNTEADIVPVSRADVAQVCVSALLDPSALNKCVYMTKKKVGGRNVLHEEDISAKFDAIPSDKIV